MPFQGGAAREGQYPELNSISANLTRGLRQADVLCRFAPDERDDSIRKRASNHDVRKREISRHQHPGCLGILQQTAGNIRPISVNGAVEDFIRRKQASAQDAQTKSGYRSRLRMFSKHCGDVRLDEVTARQVDDFLQTISEGNRRSFWKALSPFFKHAVLQHWVIKNPLLEISQEERPKWSEPKREIYTTQQYASLLRVAKVTD